MTPLDLFGCLALSAVAVMAALVAINALDDLAERRRGRARLPTVLARLDAHGRAIQRLQGQEPPAGAPRSDREGVVVPLHRPRSLRAVAPLPAAQPARRPGAGARFRRPPSIIGNDSPA